MLPYPVSATILPHFKIAQAVRSHPAGLISFYQIPSQKASPKMRISKIFFRSHFLLAPDPDLW